jgi:ABC-2 type transport system permease protein
VNPFKYSWTWYLLMTLNKSIINKLLVYFKQIMHIAYFAGILWLRRNPMSLAFATLSPFSLLFILLIISNGQYIQFAVAGSLVMTMVSFGLGLGEDIAYYRIDYKIQDIFVASPISQFAYMTGMTLSELLFGLPVMCILFFLALHFGAHITDLPTIICTSLLIWGTMSSLGFFLSTHMSHTRNVRQIISFVTVLMTVMPPVFYSVDKLPVELKYLTYAIPTTQSSLIIQHVMGFHTPKDWSIYLAFSVQIIYLIAFTVLANTRAQWREN